MGDPEEKPSRTRMETQEENWNKKYYNNQSN